MPKFAVAAISLLLGGGLLLGAGVRETECSYLKDPQRFTFDRVGQNQARTSAVGAVVRWTMSIDDSPNTVPVSSAIPRRNFIDDEIFTRMAAANINPAPLAGDAEFLRRVSLDLTGRLPSPNRITSFIDDTSSSKRDAIVDSLIASPEFVDKWTMFFGDLFQNDVINSQVDRGTQGRDAFYLYIRESIRQNKRYDQMAREMIAGSGDGWSVGPANWQIGTTIFAGPVQDTYDGGAVKVATHFLGIGAMDCLLCHDGARHLDQLNLWGANQTRSTAWGLSAFFSRTSMTRAPGAGIVVNDVSSGGYELNTDWGNRVARFPVDTGAVVGPRYPFDTSANRTIAEGENYRDALARMVTGDLQFSRAAVNYVWEKLMTEALVSPSNGFDLARLDPNNPPPAPWTLQPTNPQLLDRLARDFQQNGFNLRLLIGNIVKSSTYQLSSTYAGTWEPRFVPYYARKYVRRLDAEEIVDAIMTATSFVSPSGELSIGSPTYTIAPPSTLPPVRWAMQLPDTIEPRSGSPFQTVLDVFGRGDRDQNPRHNDSSILQALTLMNNAQITSRMTYSPQALNRVSLIIRANPDPEYVIRQMFLYTLARPVTDAELRTLLPFVVHDGVTLTGASLQWTLMNRLQFLFNY